MTLGFRQVGFEIASVGIVDSRISGLESAYTPAEQLAGRVSTVLSLLFYNRTGFFSSHKYLFRYICDVLYISTRHVFSGAVPDPFFFQSNLVPTRRAQYLPVLDPDSDIFRFQNRIIPDTDIFWLPSKLQSSFLKG